MVTMAQLSLIRAGSRLLAAAALLCGHAVVVTDAYYLPGVNPQSFTEGDV